MAEVVVAAASMYNFTSATMTQDSRHRGRNPENHASRASTPWGASAYARRAWFARRPGTSLSGMASLTRSARLLRTLIVGACVFPLVQACGRSEPGDYLYNSDGTISEAASSS